jgi:asparagine synthetase B (glutamine-hydrolysing)
MCGIAGFITDSATDIRHNIAIAILAKHMDDRGGHSWGTMADNHIFHALGAITRGFAVTPALPQRFALHTRYGTTGANVVANAHPFRIAGSERVVTGMHNGIISNHGDLNQRYHRACAVDSQHIFHAIADGKTLDDIEGYGAIVYETNGAWYIGRFNEGEMSVALTDCGVFFASTMDALREALSFAGVPVTRWLNVRNNSVYTITATGIKKAYKVKARGTTRRWNDRQPIDLTWARDDRWAKDEDYYADLTIRPTRSHTAKDECDLCSEVGELYDCEKQLVCAECYAAITDTLPAGYVDEMELNAYAYASRRSN